MNAVHNNRHDQHPCFNAEARKTNARIHLPVAPRCNVQCMYCNRDFDCANESRPGVTSAVLAPEQALAYTLSMAARWKNLSVVGIAGPGDPFANADETLETLQLVRNALPDVLLCVATNGLGIGPYLDRLAQIRVSHVTLTINAIDPAIGAKIYSWYRYNGRAHSGLEGAAFLWERQREAIIGLSGRGILVKINSICIPGINEHHIADVAKTCADLGAEILNVMPLRPTAGTPFANVREPAASDLARIRNEAQHYLPQMAHCSRCRADAAGIIGAEQDPEAQRMLMQASHLSSEPVRSFRNDTQAQGPVASRQFVAVATHEGALINQHLGEADSLHIYKPGADGAELIDVREAPAPGSGNARWERLSELLGDCSAVLVNGIGLQPKRVLEEHGITVYELEGFIEEALARIARGDSLDVLARRSTSRCASACSGTGANCG